jgi:hypothetical protein
VVGGPRSGGHGARGEVPFKEASLNRTVRRRKITTGSFSRGVAQLGRALRSGRRGRTFKSCRPDSNSRVPRAARSGDRLFLQVTCFLDLMPLRGAYCAPPSKSAAITTITMSVPSICSRRSYRNTIQPSSPRWTSSVPMSARFTPRFAERWAPATTASGKAFW